MWKKHIKQKSKATIRGLHRVLQGPGERKDWQPQNTRQAAQAHDSLQKKATATCLDSWFTMFQNEKYRGHNFLLL